MHFLSLVLLATLIPVAIALRCHQTVTALSIDQPVTTSAQECPANSLTCTKAVDMNTRSYTKGCAYTNCTAPSGFTNQPATCFNYSTLGREAYQCCCYGDGCNSAPQSSMVIAGVTMMFSLFF